MEHMVVRVLGEYEALAYGVQDHAALVMIMVLALLSVPH